MGAIREFKSTYHDRKQFMVAVCGKCGFEGERPRPYLKFGSGSDDEQRAAVAKRKFETSGWIIGNRASDDRCPACVKAVENAKKPTLTVVKDTPTMSKPAIAVTNEPKQMSREDGRVIFAKLEEVYRDERNGYSPGWTDEKVAIDLGVPRAWVAKVRVDFFGAEQSNPEITNAVNEAKTYMEESRAIYAKIEQTRAALGSLMAEAQKVATRGEQIEKRLAAIEKALRA